MKAVIYPFGPEEPVLQLTQDFSELDWAIVSSSAALAREIGDAAILVTSNRVCNAAYGEVLRRHARALRWMHFGSAGIERGVAMGIPDGVVVTNSAGVKATMVSEHAVTLLLALMRQLPALQAHQRAHRYLREETNRKLRTLEGATVCVIGLGHIGREVARKVRAFDARVIGVSRAGAAGGDVETVFPRARIHEALALADAVVICTDGDASSDRLIGAAEFAALKPGAYIVNVARGNIIDEAALIGALRGGRLAGAGLDVTEEEPVPPDSPLWDIPEVLVSPHIAGGGSTGYPQQKKLFSDNLQRFQTGRPLLNACKIPAKA